MKIEGFLSDQDVNTINLTKGNIILEYDDPNVGKNKPVTIDKRYIHTKEGKTYRDVFLQLEGTGSVNYKLDEESLHDAGGIVGDIIPRPLTIKFYSVVKEYDGTPYFEREYLRYQFCKTGQTESGLVLGTDRIYPYLKVTDISIESSLDNRFPQASGLYTLNGFEPHKGKSDSFIAPEIGPEGFHDHEMICRTSFPVCVNRDEGTFTLVANESTFLVPSEYMKITGNSQDCKDNGELLNESYIHTSSKPLPFTLDRKSTLTEGEPIRINMTQKLLSDNLNSPTPIGKRFSSSDVGKVLVDVDKASLPSKNVCDLHPLTFENVRLVEGINNNICKNNYIIDQVYGYGLVYKRVTNITIRGKSKIYDGTCNLDYELYSVDRLVDGDEVSLNNEIKLWCWKEKDVNSRPCALKDFPFDNCLVGTDGANYNVYDVVLENEHEINILKREITPVLDTLRIYPSTSKFEIKYELKNTIASDDIYIDLTSAVVTLPDGSEIEDVFVSNNLISSSIVTWCDDHNAVMIGDHEVKDTDLVSIKNIKIAGNDSDNYTLTTTELNTIPIRIMHVH